MIIADESLNGNIVRELRELELEVDWILESKAGIADSEVIEYAKENNGLLITEDKDFGEWVFSHKIDGLTIVFLRYEKHEFDEILDSLKSIIFDLIENPEKPPHEFVTINKNKIRRRYI